nr:hypothetical protein [Tanacetum cinerariifolium]
MRKYTRFDAQSFKDAMIFNMDSIRKYMLEIILHQQRTPHLLKQKKLMQTQEDYSNPTPTLNVDSLKVDLIVIQNTCFEKEDNNSETTSSKLVKECSLDSATNVVHEIKYKMSKAKERCMAYRLQKKLDKDDFQEDGSMEAFWVVNNQFQKFIDSKFTLDYDIQMTDKYFIKYTRIEYDRRVNKRHMQTQESKIDTGKAADVGLVVTESSGTELEVQDNSSRLGNDIDADDADIKPIYDEEPMVKWWIPTRKLFDSCTSKVDSEPTHGSNVDIPNIHESKQTLDLSAGTSINVKKEQSLDFSAERGETSSHHVDSSKMHTFYQRHPSEHHWTKDHPLEQVIGNPSQLIRTRCQLETSGEMCMFALTVSLTEPKNIKEAMANSAWIESMQEELHQFDRLDVWELVDIALCKNVINMKWLWKNKCDEENTVIYNKSRLVAKGYAQKEGLISKNHLYQLLGWKLSGYLLHGFIDPYHPDQVYRLKKALYGLKQAPRAWYDELFNFLISKGFSKGYIDLTLFITKHGEDILLVQIYEFRSTKPRGIFINQAKYAQEILKKHGMNSCDSIGTLMATKHLDDDLSGTSVDQTKYRSMVRALMYLTASRPDIVHATCYCAHYQAKPTEKHLTVVKWIFRYLKDTINIGLWYPKDTGFELTAFSYLDHAGCLDSRKSISGGVQFLDGDKLVSWSSKKQDCTSMSLTEADYVSLSACCAQVLWLRTQLTDYGFHFDKIPMYCDSMAAITISCNPVQHSRTKHIDVRYHLIKEKVEKGIVELFFVGTEYQLADQFTKALSEDMFKYLVRQFGMRCLTSEELEILANESA